MTRSVVHLWTMFPSPLDSWPALSCSSSSSWSRIHLKSSRDRRKAWKARGPQFGRMSNSLRVFCRLVARDSMSSTWVWVRTFSWYRNGMMVSLTRSWADNSSRCSRNRARCSGSISARITSLSVKINEPHDILCWLWNVSDGKHKSGTMFPAFIVSRFSFILREKSANLMDKVVPNYVTFTLGAPRGCISNNINVTFWQPSVTWFG